MFRDFSESAKAKLLEYVSEVTETSRWGKVGDAIGDAGLQVQSWLGFLNVSGYVKKLDQYHKKVLDKNNTTKKQIEQIFSNVNVIDVRYEKGMAGEVSKSKKILQFVKHLSECIDPNGGNLNLEKMGSVLKADVEAIQESRATMQKTIDDQMLGTDPEAASTSIDPVNLSTGNYIYDHVDLTIGGEIPLSFHRFYNSKDVRISTLGKSFRHNYEICVKVDDNGDADLVLADGQHKHFKNEENKYIGTDTNGEILSLGKEGCFKLELSEGEIIKFNSEKNMIRRENRNGVGISFLYNEKQQLIEARNDYNDYLKYEYDNKSGFLIKVTDQTGRNISMTYDGHALKTVEFFTGRIISYQYGMNGRISELTGSDTGFNVRNEYDTQFRVTKQMFPDGSTMSFLYDDEKKTVTQIERNGFKTVYVHDDSYRNTEIKYEDGTSESYIYNECNQCIRYKDRLGNVQRMSYDNRGNLVQKIDALKRRYNMTYDVYNNLLSISINGKTRLKNFYDRTGNLIKTENYYGNGMEIVNDEKGRPITNIRPDGSKIELVYDEQGNISEMTNPYGGSVKYFYDNLHQVTKVIDARGNESCFAYNQMGNIVKETNAVGDSRHYSYNKENLLSEIIDYNGTTTKRSYNAINKLEKFVDQAGNATTLSYDCMWNISKMVLPNGAVTSYGFDSDNRLTEVKDALGNSTFIEYDANGNCVAEIKGESRTEYVYDQVGRVIEMKTAEGGVQKYTYDSDDNIVHITDALGNEVELEYDEAGYLICEKSSLGEERKYTYTVLGKIESIADETGRITKYFYIPGGEEVSKIQFPDGLSEEYEYDKNGNLECVKDRNGNTTQFTYDVLDRMTAYKINGQLQKEIAYDKVGNIVSVTDNAGNVTQYEYSLKGELTKVTDALGNTAEYSYDANGQLIRSIQKDTKNGSLNEMTVCERDLLGQITSISDILGNKECFKYDAQGQLIEKLDKEGYLTRYGYTKMGDVNYIQYSDGREVKMSYNALSHLEEIQDWLGITKIENDALGRALNVVYPDGQRVNYTYNISGKRTSITYPDGNRVFFNYDNLLRLASLQEGDRVVHYEYDDRSNVRKKILPNGAEAEYQYNAQGLLASIINRDSFGIMDEYLFEYDSSGKKTGVVKKRRDAVEDNGKYDYLYDLLGRLSEVKKDGKLLRSYEYDSFGNRSRMLEQGEATTYEYNQLNQLISKADKSGVETYSYDKRGNLQKVFAEGKVKQKYVYGALNRLEEILDEEGITTKYIYNGLGHRVGQEYGKDRMNLGSKITYILDMTRQYNNLLQKEENSRTQRFLWDENIVGMTLEDHQETNYFLQDEMGSPVQLLNEKGMSVERYGYDEFGRDTISNMNSVNPFGFIGYQRDKRSNTYYAQAREYLPCVGRFAARDFVKGRQDDLLSLNEYIYCKDDPHNYEDRNGMFVLTTLAIVGIGAAVGAVTSAAVNVGTQAIKIHQGKQESFKWGSLAGSVVEGAIVGGVAAIPGAGFVATVGAGAAGAAANSTISQAIDDKSVNIGKVAEDTVIGGVTSGIFYGLGKAKEAVKSKVFGKEAKESVKNLYKATSEKITKKVAQINGAINSTGRTSPHRLRQLAQLVAERNGLLKKYAWEKVKSGAKGGVKSAVYTIFGLKATKSITKDIFARLIPWYNDEKNPLEYLEDYFGTLYGKIIGKCPLYI